jgi:formylmethanofuran dehydrogenase subunit B
VTKIAVARLERVRTVSTYDELALVRQVVQIADRWSAQLKLNHARAAARDDATTWDIVHRAGQRCARVVVVDPYRSRTAERADEHLPIYPGTDGALAVGAMQRGAHIFLVRIQLESPC